VPAGKHGRGGLTVSQEFDPNDFDDPSEEMAAVASWINTSDTGAHLILYRHGDRYWAWNDWSGYVEFGRHESEETAISEWATRFSVPSFDDVDWLDFYDVGENEPPDGFEWVDQAGGFIRTDAITPVENSPVPGLHRFRTFYFLADSGPLRAEDDCLGHFDTVEEAIAEATDSHEPDPTDYLVTVDDLRLGKRRKPGRLLSPSKIASSFRRPSQQAETTRSEIVGVLSFSSDERLTGASVAHVRVDDAGQPTIVDLQPFLKTSGLIHSQLTYRTVMPQRWIVTDTPAWRTLDMPFPETVDLTLLDAETVDQSGSPHRLQEAFAKNQIVIESSAKHYGSLDWLAGKLASLPESGYVVWERPVSHLHPHMRELCCEPASNFSSEPERIWWPTEAVAVALALDV